MVRSPSFRRAVSARGVGTDPDHVVGPCIVVAVRLRCRAGGGHMPFQTRSRWLRRAVLAAAVLAMLPPGARLMAQTRQVSVESLIYDLKNPDALRRQAAVRELGAAKYRAATPNIVALANDPADAVRREVEFTLEKMEDIQTLPGFIVLASDPENDIRARAAAALVNVHLPRPSG